MKNLRPFTDDCFEIHKKAVQKKNKGELKDRLKSLNPLVEVEFKNFTDKFNLNELKSLKSNEILMKSKDDLISLYDYQNKVVKIIRNNIRDLQVKTITSTCQNCTIDSAGTLDHILPKSLFPEFSVNPLNLFPCCSTCNSYKLNDIEKDGINQFLNLYLDELPKYQYLFVEVFIDKYDEFDFKFYLNNFNNKVSENLYSVLESHYLRLRLFDRMRFKAIEYISELEGKILNFKDLLSLEIRVSELLKTAESEKEAYGFNHWKCILEISLLNSPIFMSRFG